MPISAPGSRGRLKRKRAASARGFTLIELIVVVAIVAIASALASLALRDPAASKLEHEAVRLAALLESARAEARASGIAARWEPLTQDAGGAGFRFVGLARSEPMPTHWLEAGTAAQVIGGAVVLLGPEPLIGEQRIVLRLDDQRLTLATDGIGPFTVTDDRDAAP
jgi:general secretion pathway protein H